MITAKEARNKATQINKDKDKYIESVNTTIVTVANLGKFKIDVQVPLEYLEVVKGALLCNDYDVTEPNGVINNVVTLRISW